MQPGDIATWTGVAIAVLTGVAGVAFGAISTARARSAERVAREAVEAAKRANEIAGDANQLSAEANDLVKKSIAQQGEDWFVEWVPSWNQATALIVLRNRGGSPALNVTYTVHGDQIHLAGELPDEVPQGLTRR